MSWRDGCFILAAFDQPLSRSCSEPVHGRGRTQLYLHNPDKICLCASGPSLIA
jgi:hypothetical protein